MILELVGWRVGGNEASRAFVVAAPRCSLFPLVVVLAFSLTLVPIPGFCRSQRLIRCPAVSAKQIGVVGFVVGKLRIKMKKSES